MIVVVVERGECERVREQERGGNTVRGRSKDHGKDPRVWNREEYRRLESESFSIFVDNLPEDISKRELFQLFNWTGRINDIYLSRKWKKKRHLHVCLHPVHDKRRGVESYSENELPEAEK
ncbi:uncharacterized protein DS421_18g631470 [Arachis hypogaea]|nr:uncharacterized protein DS421_18g631470 [Arachis hypogaea]